MGSVKRGLNMQSVDPFMHNCTRNKRLGLAPHVGRHFSSDGRNSFEAESIRT